MANTRALLAVAHPDDEVIFASGLLLSYPDWKWSLTCLTNGSRAQEFKAAAQEFAIRGVQIQSASLLGVPDRHDMLEGWEAIAAEGVDDLCQRLGTNFDVVFTHNRAGEYGHPHHSILSGLIRERFSNVWEFYSEDVTGKEQALLDVHVYVSGWNKERSEIFRMVYGDGVEEALRENHPEMMDWYFRGGDERYTAPAGSWWPS